MWAAKKGLEALNIDWDEGANAPVSSETIWQDLRAASEKDGVVAKSVGDIATGLAAGNKVEADATPRERFRIPGREMQTVAGERAARLAPR